VVAAFLPGALNAPQEMPLRVDERLAGTAADVSHVIIVISSQKKSDCKIARAIHLNDLIEAWKRTLGSIT
jgi:hypothetical protein